MTTFFSRSLAAHRFQPNQIMDVEENHIEKMKEKKMINVDKSMQVYHSDKILESNHAYWFDCYCHCCSCFVLLSVFSPSVVDAVVASYDCLSAQKYLTDDHTYLTSQGAHTMILTEPHIASPLCILLQLNVNEEELRKVSCSYLCYICMFAFTAHDNQVTSKSKR